MSSPFSRIVPVRRLEQPHDAVRRPWSCRCPTRRRGRAARPARSRTRRRRPRARRPPPPMRRPEPEVLDEVDDLERRRRVTLTRAPLWPGWKHATRCSGPISRSSGTSRAGAARRHAGSAARTRTQPRQLGERRHAARDLAQPALLVAAPGRGIAPSRPIVYGCCGRANSSCTGASSTLRPAYMTITRSAMSATTPRLCVIRTIAVPSRSRMSRIRSRIPAWIVTSSAVVGSSAIRIFGSQASAIAIITRWRMPPESWCGYSSTRRSGAGMPHEVEQLDRALARVAPRPRPRCRRSTSPIWSPTRERRVERRHRLLEDERDLAPADRRAAARSARRAGRRRRSRALPVDRRRLGQQAEQRHHAHALAAAGLADDAEHLAGRRA